jgi:hypothetical protein
VFIREDQADIRFWLDDVPYFGSWKTAEGGILEANDSKTRPGAMGKEVSAGGTASRDDLAITTQLTDIVALAHPTLENRTGIGRVRVRVNWLRPDRTPTGTGRTIQGTLKRAAAPDHPDGADVGMYTVIVSCDEQAG